MMRTLKGRRTVKMREMGIEKENEKKLLWIPVDKIRKVNSGESKPGMRKVKG